MLVSLPQKSHNMKELSDKQELKVRKESKHLGIKYVCDLCEYKSTKKQLLRARKDSKHNGIKYCCDECDYGANSKSILKVHIESKHHGKA